MPLLLLEVTMLGVPGPGTATDGPFQQLDPPRSIAIGKRDGAFRSWLFRTLDSNSHS